MSTALHFATRAELREWAGGPVVIESQGIACGRQGKSWRSYTCSSPRGRLSILEGEDGITVKVLDPKSAEAPA